jgi:hypothetical protein
MTASGPILLAKSGGGNTIMGFVLVIAAIALVGLVASAPAAT